MASLPPELIDSIVEHVPDEKSLLACALTASSFLNASQARIFHSISLVHDTAYERLAGILAQSPRLGTVKALVQKQLPRHPPLIGFLSLESLRCVALVKLENVPSSIVTTLLDTCVDVRLFQTSIILEDDGVQRAFPTFHPTRHLEVSESTGAITAFLALPRQSDNLRSLTKLNLSDGVPGGSAPRDTLLAACAPTLEILTIRARRGLALPALPFLRQLTLWAKPRVEGIPYTIPSSVSVALRAAPRLKKVTIRILDESMDHAFDSNWSNSPSPEWLVLDKQLSEMHMQQRWGDSDNNSQLSDVHSSLIYSHSSAERCASFETEVKRRLPQCGFTYREITGVGARERRMSGTQYAHHVVRERAQYSRRGRMGTSTSSGVVNEAPA
ncbi:hypothetical protein C8R45DRAFT_1160130 [Mycena sanguinolenta]|nr:hypothetical protein C8R45DRAFT_1160130 [Mycena sanguinolenta]